MERMTMMMANLMVSKGNPSIGVIEGSSQKLKEKENVEETSEK